MIHFKKTFKLKNKQYALAVNKVILIFKNSVFRKNIKKLLIKIKFIQKLLLKKFTKKNYLLSTSVNKWLRKIKAICFLNAQRYLQLFMRKKLNFLIVKKYNNRIIIKQLFRDYLVLKKIKPFFKEFVTFKICRNDFSSQIMVETRKTRPASQIATKTQNNFTFIANRIRNVLSVIFIANSGRNTQSVIFVANSNPNVTNRHFHRK